MSKNKNHFFDKHLECPTFRKNLFIGTSGFSYSHWEHGVFYPKDLSKSKQLEYYSENFNTVELNNPFYRLPKTENFSSWKNRTPKNFIFTIKVSRFITHIKRFNDCELPWQTFFERALYLEEKLGPFLFQLPPNFSATKINMERLDNFLKLVTASKLPANRMSGRRAISSQIRFVFEFRHQSWFSDNIYQLLKKYKNVSLCLADSPDWPFKEVIIGNFVYIRLHGGKILYSSNYSRKELKVWAEKIKKYLKKRFSVHIYFNNDSMGYAVKNAKTLLEFCKMS